MNSVLISLGEAGSGRVKQNLEQPPLLEEQPPETEREEKMNNTAASYPSISTCTV